MYIRLSATPQISIAVPQNRSSSAKPFCEKVMADQKKTNSFVLGVLEGAEAAVDFATSNEAVKAVPVVSTAIRLLEGLNDFRSRLLESKLKRFLAEPSLLRSLKAQKLRAEILDDPDEAARIGDTLFMIIDKVTDSEKPTILARVYAHFHDGFLTAEDFFLLGHCIDICALADLRSFIESRGAAHSISPAGQRRLVTAGILESRVTNSTILPTVRGVDNNSVRTYFEVSQIGEALIRAMDAANLAQ